MQAFTKHLQKGFCHVYTPHGATVCASSDLLLSGTPRDAEDLKRIRERFGQLEDPCYHPAFRRDRADFHLQKQKGQGKGEPV